MKSADEEHARTKDVTQNALDRLVQLALQTLLDARPGDHRADLADSLPGQPPCLRCTVNHAEQRLQRIRTRLIAGFGTGSCEHRRAFVTVIWIVIPLLTVRRRTESTYILLPNGMMGPRHRPDLMPTARTDDPLRKRETSR